MASKFYLTNSAPSATPSTFHGAWDAGTGSAVTKLLGETPSGAGPTSIGIAEGSGTNNWDVALGQWISEPLVDIVTFTQLSDTWTAIFGASESNAGANDFGHAYIWVWKTGTLDESRGNLVVDQIDSVEWPTTAVGVEFNNSATNALSNTVACAPGDRIVVEFGYRAQNTNTTSCTGTMWYGGTNGDLTEGGNELTLS